jgi:uncharacterized Zn finger protein
MCKHVAASLYGVGARLDHEPEMLFSLRGVDPAAMIEEAIDRGVTGRKKARGRLLKRDDLSSVFGVDIDFGDETLSEEAPKKQRKTRPSTKPKTSGLTDRAERVLATITDEPDLRTPQLAERLGMPRSTVASCIAQLKSRGLIVFVGAPRNGGYRPTDSTP